METSLDKGVVAEAANVQKFFLGIDVSTKKEPVEVITKKADEKTVVDKVDVRKVSYGIECFPKPGNDAEIAVEFKGFGVPTLEEFIVFLYDVFQCSFF